MFESLETRQMFSTTVAVDPGTTQTTDTTPPPTVEADIHFTKVIDKASPNLYLNCATGTHVK